MSLDKYIRQTSELPRKSANKVSFKHSISKFSPQDYPGFSLSISVRKDSYQKGTQEVPLLNQSVLVVCDGCRPIENRGQSNHHLLGGQQPRMVGVG